jgi:hypothetical protein
MAMRLATEYVKTYMQLSEPDFAKFIQLFEAQQAVMQIKVLENGNQEVVLQDDAGQEIVLSFERKAGFYILEGSCRITNLQLVNSMRKAVSSFKGSAIVHRIYERYTMVYHYEHGAVVKILEVSDRGSKLIYEQKDTIGELNRLFQCSAVEQEIVAIRDQIDVLLDLRNETKQPDFVMHVDDRLQHLTNRLFVLEA